MIRVLLRLPRSLKVILTLAVCGLIGVAPAYAYWSLTATANASAQADSLTAPAAPSVGSPTTTTLTVSGTLPGTQLAGAAYAVKRGTTTVCAPSTSPFSCTDTGLSNGTTYSYTVVATLSTWTVASAATTGTTSCTTPDAFTVAAPSTATAGTAFSVSLTAKRCDGTVDTTYTGTKPLTWGSVIASPTGDTGTLPTTAAFTSGVATISATLFGAGSSTLTATASAVTGSSSAIAVAAGAPVNFTLSNATSKAVAVTVTCSALTKPPSARTCTATDPAVNGQHDWLATAGLLDTWGNAATTASALTVTVDTGNGTPTTAIIAVGSGSAPITAPIANKATVTITVSASGLQNLVVTNAR